MADKSPRNLRSRSRRFRLHLRSLFRQFIRGLWTLRTLICLIGSLAILLLFMAAIVPARYRIYVGMVPTHTITANRDVVDEITTQKHKDAAAAAVVPTFYYAEGVTEDVLKHFNTIHAQMEAAVQYSETLDGHSPMRYYTEEERAYARSILTDINLSDHQLRTLLNTPRSNLTDLHDIIYVALQDTLSSKVAEGDEQNAVDRVLQVVGYQVSKTVSSSFLVNVVQPMLRTVIVPNMLIDQEATEAARQLARDHVEPVVYKQGQNIVVKGEGRVEKYQYDMLANLGLLSDASGDISIYLGAVLLVALVLTTALITLRIISPDDIKNNKKILLIFLVSIITLVLSIVLRLINVYLAPVALCAILLASMLNLRVAVVLNVALSVLISALAAGGSTSYTAEMVQLLSCSMVSGVLSALLVYKHSNRLRIIGSGFIAALGNFIMLMALGLMTSSTIASVATNALWCAVGGLLSGLAAIAVQPVLEAAFNLATPTKLMELSNPNHPLLRRLLLEAPGTYHHSIVVANLAEAAAEAVGANPLLARVGGYYHDVGKLRRPQYFKENQLGVGNKLNEVDPYTAAQIIIAHPRDGVTLARSYRLPKEVCSMIQEHHGNTPVMYFYSKAVREMGAENVDIAAFRYDATPPSTKEGAVLLLCDTIEAAVRSMNNPTPDAIEEFIVKLVRGKLQDGQLSLSPLTLRDIDAICKACSTVLNGVFHERIEYPDMPTAPAPAAEKPVQPVKIRVPDADEPWDGEAAEEDEATASSLPTSEAEPDVDLLNTPVIVEPEQFEPVAPVRMVEMPASTAPVSIDEVLRSKEQPASENGEMPNE